MLEWDRVFPGRKLDKDNPEDMQWVFERARERAEKFGIDGVTYFKTIGVVKNIIPAVASTNAAVSAVCVGETIKLLTYYSQTVNNYFMFMGAEGVYSPTFVYERNELCPVCSDAVSTRTMKVNALDVTLKDFLVQLAEAPFLQLHKPSVIGETSSLYMQKPPSLEAKLRPNLDLPLAKLVHDGEVLSITDPSLRDTSVSIRLEFI